MGARLVTADTRRYSVSDHILFAIFDQANVFRCDVCGMETRRTTGIIHWLRWVAHDLTVGWSDRHWSTYRW